MREIKKFTSRSDFDDYIRSYMLNNKLDNAYVSLRYGYTEKQMNEQDFEIQICSIHNFYALQWWLNWWKGQEFIELQGILSPGIISLLRKFEDAEIFKKLENNDQSNKWIVTYAGYNAPDGYPEYKYVCPYCGGGNGGKYCCDCGRRIEGQIPDETVVDDFKEIFIDNNDNEEN